MILLESSGVSDRGIKRKHNEDSLYLDNDNGLFVVADGMGGHNAGEVASKLLVDTVRDYMQRFHPQGQNSPEEIEELEDSDLALSKSGNRLLSSIHLANKVIFQLSSQKEQYRGMGTTVSSLYFNEDTLVILNVGDSPIYLIRDNSLRLLSTPHTVEAEHAALAAEGKIPVAGIFSHMLTRAIGTKPNIQPDVMEMSPLKNDVFIICSDGLSNLVTETEIGKLASSERPQKACKMLLDLALQRGGDDNITIIAVKVKKSKPGKQSPLKRLKNIIRK